MATAVKQVSPPAVCGGFDRTAWNIEDRAKLVDGPIDAGKQGRLIGRGPVVKARLERGAAANGGGQQ
jgi:hypothetical protein